MIKDYTKQIIPLTEIYHKQNKVIGCFWNNKVQHTGIKVVREQKNFKH